MYDDSVFDELGKACNSSARFQVNRPRVEGLVTSWKLKSLIIVQSTTEAWKLPSSQGTCDSWVKELGTCAAAAKGDSGTGTGVLGIRQPVDGSTECTFRT